MYTWVKWLYGESTNCGFCLNRGCFRHPFLIVWCEGATRHPYHVSFRYSEWTNANVLQSYHFSMTVSPNRLFMASTPCDCSLTWKWNSTSPDLDRRTWVSLQRDMYGKIMHFQPVWSLSINTSSLITAAAGNHGEIYKVQILCSIPTTYIPWPRRLDCCTHETVDEEINKNRTIKWCLFHHRPTNTHTWRDQSRCFCSRWTVKANLWMKTHLWNPSNRLMQSYDRINYKLFAVHAQSMYQYIPLLPCQAWQIVTLCMLCGRAWQWHFAGITRNLRRRVNEEAIEPCR